MARQVIIPLTLDPAAMYRPPSGADRVHLSGETMGTNWSATYFSDKETNSDIVKTDLENIFSAIIADFSNWDPSSFISRYNSAETGTNHPLSPAFAQVISAALDLACKTNGAFNPCLGEQTPYLQFYAGSHGTPSMPSGHSADQYDRIATLQAALDVSNNRLVQPGDLRLDLSAIAKGYAVDAMASYLKRSSVRSFLVEIGGEYSGFGVKEDGTPWWVEMTQPHDTQAMPYIAALCGCAVATSGHGHRITALPDLPPVSHIVGQASCLSTVTVLAGTCADADAWATALMAAGSEKAETLAAQHEIAALLCHENGRCLASPRLTAMLQ